jgi:MoxR-like ATPase
MTSLRFSGTDDYLSSAALTEAVNVAIGLQKPLLIKGEPGTGKTRLAEAIASNLGKELISWNVKSTTKAQDGLYVYDTVQRLNDARFGDGDIKDVARYIRYGAMGRSFLSSQKSILLIDEIDKADMEFPNDLLHELDRMRFEVLETSAQIEAKERPIVIITSNNEKELPDAFLRRCVFHWIEFPNKDFMAEIVKVHHPEIEQDLLQQCLKRFYWIRDLPELRKRPSTSELVDWIGALRHNGVSAKEIENNLPFLGVLLKHENDFSSVRSPKRRSANW